MRLSPVLLVLAVAGCSDIVLPGDAVVACADDGSCPGGTTCNVAINRCLPATPIETDAPVASDVDLDPADGKAGDAFTVSFTVDEALGAVPSVVVDVGGGDVAAFVVVDGDVANPSLPWLFTYTATGDEQPGPRTVSLGLVDIWGNAVDVALDEPLTLDFEAPTDVVLSAPAVAAAAAGVSVTVSASNAVSGVLSGDVVAAVDVDLSGGGDVDVRVDLAPGEGPRSLRFDVVDAVGNVAAAVPVIVTVDGSVPFSRPTLTLPVGQTAIKDGDTLVFGGQVTPGAALDEARLVDDAGVLVAGLDGSDIVVDADGAISGDVVVADFGVVAAVRLEVVVRKGAVDSPTDDSRSDAVVVDNVAPENVTCALPPRVIATSVELVVGGSGFVDVAVDGDLAEDRAFAPAPVDNRLNLVLEPGDGNKVLTVHVRDGAHNVDDCVASTTLDSRPPAIGRITLTPPGAQTAVKRGDVVEVDAFVDVGGVDVSAARVLDQDLQERASLDVADFAVDGIEITGSFVVDDAVLAGAAPTALLLELTVSEAGLTSAPGLSAVLLVDLVAPDPDPTLSAPAGQTAVKGLDVVRFGGVVEAGTSVVSARLVADDDSVVADVTSQLRVVGTAIEGSFTLGDVTGIASLSLEVIARDGAQTSQPAASRSGAVVVDVVSPAPACPADVRVGVANIDLAFPDGGADVASVRVDGSGIAGAAAGAFVDVAASVPLTLVGADGARVLTLTWRDGAFHTTTCLQRVLLDTTPPAVAPRLVPPAGQTAIKNGDVVGVSGPVEAGSVVVAASLVDEDGVVVADVSDFVDVAGSVLAGSIVVGVVDADEVRLEVELSDGLNSGTTQSPAVDVDNDAPGLPIVSLPGGAVTGAFNISVVVACAADAVDVAVGGDVAIDDGVFRALPPGGAVGVILDGGQGQKNLAVSCRDGAHNISPTATAQVFLATDDVRSSPVITLPNGQRALKNGDVVQVSGSGEPGAVVVSARLVDVAGNATAQDVTGVVINDGDLGGAFVTSGLVDGRDVVLEVILRARGRDSVAAQSRSLSARVDLLPPAGVSVAVVLAGVPVSSVAVARVQLDIRAGTGTEVQLSGDITDAIGAPDVIAVGPVVAVPTGLVSVDLSGADGSKAINVLVRDDAHNFVIASTSVGLDRSVPTSTITLGSRRTVPKVKNGDRLDLTGSATGTGLVRDAVTLLGLNDADVALAGAGCAVAVPASAVAFDGTSWSADEDFVASLPGCPAATRIALRAQVKNAAGTPSVAALSTSNSLKLDNTAPQLPALSLVLVAPAIGRGSRFANITVTPAVSADADEAVSATFDGDIVGVGPVAFTGANQNISLVGADGDKQVRVRFTDDVGNVSTVVTLVVALDRAVPAAPLAQSLRLREVALAANDPARLDEDVDNTLEATALAGAVAEPNDTRIDLCADANCDVVVAPLLALTAGQLPPTSIAHNAAQQVFFRAVDGAGNSSAATGVVVPRVSFGVIAPAFANVDDEVVIPFTTSVPPRVTPVVVVDGNAAVVSVVGVNSFVARYDTRASEGDGAAVVRATVEDGQINGGFVFAAGTTGTDAVTTVLDFTAPVIDAARVTVGENDPGSADVVSGGSGAVVDGIDPAVAVSLVAAAFSAGPVDTSGGGAFSALAFGDNARAAVTLRAEDDAGNVATLALVNDVAAPVASALVASPADAKDGTTMTITFHLDDVRRLRAVPVVTVGGRAATRVSGDGTGGSGALNESYVYSFVVDNNPDVEGTRDVVVSFVDAVGNAGSTKTPVRLDFTRPTTSSTTPGDRQVWNLSPGALGTASDAFSGVARVEVAVGRCTALDVDPEAVQPPCAADAFLNAAGTAFVAGGPVFVAVDGTVSWSEILADAPFDVDARYEIHARSIDRAGNVSNEDVDDFFYDNFIADAPTNLTASSPDEATVQLSWTAPAGVIDHYEVYYDVATGAHPPYLGTSLTVDDSPIVVAGDTTELEVVGLERERYAFAVTAVTDDDVESAYSNQAEAASRFWEWKSPGRTATSVGGLVSFADGEVLTLQQGGVLNRRSPVTRQWSTEQLLVGGVAPALSEVGRAVTLGDVVVLCALDPDRAHVILRSADRGHSWSVVSSGRNGGNNCADVATDGVGVAVAFNRFVFISTDGGLTFPATLETDNNNLRFFEGVAISGQNVVGANDEGAYTMTSNAGLNQTSFRIGHGTGGRFVVGDGARFWVGGDSAALVVRNLDIVNTPNAWVEVAIPDPVFNQGGGLVKSGAALLYASTGGVFRSIDDGATWTATVTATSPRHIGAIAGAGGADVYAVDDTFFANNTTALLHSSDSGLTFSRSPPTSDVTVTASQLTASGSTAVATPFQGFPSVETNDAAGSVELGGGPSLFTREVSVCLSGDRVVVAGGGDIFTSDDGAETFVSRGATPGGFNAVCCNGPVVYAAGDHSAVARSDDGGTTFVASHANDDLNMRDVGCDGDVVVLSAPDRTFGNSSVTQGSRDGGQSWVTSPQIDSDRQRLAVRGLDIIATTPNGDGIFSTDGGQTWQRGQFRGAGIGQVQDIATTADAFLILGSQSVARITSLSPLVRTTTALPVFSYRGIDAFGDDVIAVGSFSARSSDGGRTFGDNLGSFADQASAAAPYRGGLIAGTIGFSLASVSRAPGLGGGALGPFTRFTRFDPATVVVRTTALQVLPDGERVVVAGERGALAVFGP